MSADQKAADLSAQEDVALKRLDLAAKAEHVLGSGLVADAFEAVRAALLAEIERARLDTNVEDFRKGLWALAEVKKLLQRHIETGKIAQKDMAHIRQQRGLMSRIRRVA